MSTSTRAPATLEPDAASTGRERDDSPKERPALMIAWSVDEPGRVGEVALFEMDGFAQILGRGEPGTKEPLGRVAFCRHRPGGAQKTTALQSPAISREQLRIVAKKGLLYVERIGRCPVLFRGENVNQCVLSPGDRLVLERQLLLLCVERAHPAPALRDFSMTRAPAFGDPDVIGLLGESPVAWRLRDTLAFHAKAGAHTLVLGPSGAGKELAAHALHVLSSRAEAPFIARNAATLPPGLVEAELFGNVKNYPNPGMPERTGLIGAATGGTLFLDEIGELPVALHASLLRVLDGDGEYHRLGEAKPRRAKLCLVGATNRPPDALKHDLLARFPLRIEVPGLDERRDDIPLFVNHLLKRALAKAPDLAGRFVGADGRLQVSSKLMEHALVRPYTTHVRELDSLLWRAMAMSPGPRLRRPDEPPKELAADPPKQADAEATPREPSLEEIRASAAEHGGNLAKAARALGLPSRYSLYRLLRRHGVDPDDVRGEEA